MKQDTSNKGQSNRPKPPTRQKLSQEQMDLMDELNCRMEDHLHELSCRMKDHLHELSCKFSDDLDKLSSKLNTIIRLVVASGGVK